MLFTYVATSTDGAVKKGELEAPDKGAAILLLKKQALQIVKVDRKIKKAKKDIAIGGIKFVDKVLLARHLAIMIKAGVNMAEALEILVEQASNPKLRKILTEVSARVVNGHTLSSSIALYPKEFSELFINMIAVGETSGTLAANLEYLAGEMEKSYELKKKIKSASIYPMIVLVATFGLAFILVYFILPKMIKLFETMTVELPLSTRILIAVAKGFEEHGLLILIIIGIVVIGGFFTLRQKKVKKYTHKFLLKLPVMGHISQQLNLANFNRTLGILLTSGVPAVEALNITAGVLNNYTYKEEVRLLAKTVERGLSISEALSTRSTKIFPRMSTRLLGVGEKTGELDSSLNYLGDFYGREVDNITKNLSNILEPMLLIIIGLAVGFVAISIIQPVYKISGGLRK
ncbi:MAG: type II secretion system F family protein [Candidatus Komeilibacteria bacterium]